jgi:hypothetical protein
MILKWDLYRPSQQGLGKIWLSDFRGEDCQLICEPISISQFESSLGCLLSLAINRIFG